MQEWGNVVVVVVVVVLLGCVWLCVVARVRSNAKRVQVRCAHWMMRVVFSAIRLGPKTSECEKHVSVKSTATGCDVTNCATTLQGFNKHASSRREAASD